MNQDENSTWDYKPDGKDPVPDLPDDDQEAPSPEPHHSSKSESVSWQAPEFIDHPHPGSWYAALLLITVALTATVYVFTRDYFATGTIVVVGIIVGVAAGRKPSLANYELTDTGLNINSKSYPYSSFKSFTTLHEGSLNSINFFPLKRFMPPVSAYFVPADESRITDLIGDHLPYEERQMDTIDRISRRLRF